MTLFHGENSESVPFARSARILPLGLTMSEVENYPKNSEKHVELLASLVVDCWDIRDLMRFAKDTLQSAYTRDEDLFIEDYLWHREDFDERGKND